MPAGDDAQFARLVQTARDLLANSSMLSQQKWAATAGVAALLIRDTYMADADRRQAVQQATGARWVQSEGGWFLVK